jgi:hypothetical protein
VPAVVQPPAPGAATVEQTPTVAPAAFVHEPPQQSRSAPQASPFWTQNEGDDAQTPPLQNCEQHSPPAAHGLPAVLHVVLSGVHFPPSHLPPQHSALPPHGALSAMHWDWEHLFATHETVQQSGPAVHASPGSAHARPPDVAVAVGSAASASVEASTGASGAAISLPQPVGER